MERFVENVRAILWANTKKKKNVYQRIYSKNSIAYTLVSYKFERRMLPGPANTR